MNSFNYYISKYSIELNLIAKKGWQFNSEGKLLPNCTSAVLPKAPVLAKIYETLQHSPVCGLDLEKCRKFTKNINRFTSSANQGEAVEVKRISSKILRLVKKNTQELPRCFTTPSAHKVNAILDKDVASIAVIDYWILYDLANLLAASRFFIHILYLRSAIQCKIKELQLQAPDLKLYQKEGEAFYKIEYRHPFEAKDCEFALSIEWNYKLNPQPMNASPRFMKSIIKRKIESCDLQFKNYLDQLLCLHLIAALGAYSDEIDANCESHHNSFKHTQTNQKILNALKQELIHHPKSYNEWDGANNPYDNPKKLATMAKEVSETSSLVHLKFDEWYNLLLEKILDYKQFHPEAALPPVSLETFSNYRNFIDKDNIQLPLAKELELWTKEAQRTFDCLHSEAAFPPVCLETFSNDRNFLDKDPTQLPLAKELKLSTQDAQQTFDSKLTAPSSTKKTKSRRPRGKAKIKAEIPKNSLEDRAKESLSTERILKGEVEKSNEEIEKSTHVDHSAKHTTRKKKKKRGKAAPSPLMGTQLMDEGSVHDLLLKSSPFAVKKRITDWFNPSASVKILDAESLLMHQFAWAAQQVIWEVGLRHYYLNPQGFYQPAIALFCDVRHQLFLKPEPFLITVTFDHNVEQSKRDSNFKFDPTWECYHRTLTRRHQQDQLVNEYMEIARNRFIDFPPLPSQAEQVDIPALLDKKPFPDRSFIESIDGGTITIRDPKFDGNTKCRIRLFIHPSYID